MPVKGAEGAAKLFTLDGQAVFCYRGLFRHPVRIVDCKLSMNDCALVNKNWTVDGVKF